MKKMVTFITVLIMMLTLVACSITDNENVEIFSLDRICTVLNCDLDDIVEYVPNNPDITEDAKTAQKEAAASHPAHTPSK